RREAQTDPLPELGAETRRRDDAQPALADLNVNDLLASHRLDDVDLAVRLALTWRDDREVLRADADGRGRRRFRTAGSSRQRELDPLGTRDEGAVARREVGGEEVHRRRADELRDELVHRPRVKLGRRRVRLEHAVTHERDAVLLATGELRGSAIEHCVDLDERGGLAHAPLALFLAHGTAKLEREADVLGDRHVRVQRVALEDHADPAFLWEEVIDTPVAE